jgi:hypothetical protein
MPVIIESAWHGVTKAQYERVRRRVDWEREPPRGGLSHVVWFAPDALHVVDIWNSIEDHRRFTTERLTPVVKRELGFASAPEVIIRDVHEVFIPALIKDDASGLVTGI